MGTEFVLRPVGHVQSELTDPALAPRQGDEGAPEAWLVLDAEMSEAARNLEVGQEVVVLTWLHRAERNVLVVRPRSDPSRPEQGVFSTRSPARPNPIGLHRTTITAIEGNRLKVSALEAIDGTPLLDIKPVLREIDER
jgi:tRNA-Thr(GGU) m(6)t(6)A37 methyltransferase TsaA